LLNAGWFQGPGLEEAEEEIGERGGQEWAVDEVEDAAEAGDEAAGVFDAGVAFYQAFQEVAGLSDGAQNCAEEEGFGDGVEGAEVFGPDACAGEGDEGGGDEAEEEAFPGFAGAEPGDEFVSAEGSAAEIGADVGGFDDQEDHDHCGGGALEACGVMGMFDAQGHEEPAEAAEIEDGEDGSGHVGEGLFGVAVEGLSDGGGDHDGDDDEREGAGGEGLEESELGEEGMEAEERCAGDGDGFVGGDAFGGEKSDKLEGGDGEDDDHHGEDSDAGEAEMALGVDDQPADAVVGFGPDFDLAIEPEAGEKAGQEERAVGESISEGFLHGSRRRLNYFGGSFSGRTGRKTEVENGRSGAGEK